MGETTELPFDRPRTAREEAAAIERAKRDAEVAELRRIRNAAGDGANAASRGADIAPPSPPPPSAQVSAAEAARRRRDEEIEQLRRLKAGENEETRRRLQERGGTLTVDMDAWRSEQQGAKNRDRKNVLDARQNLHGHGATDVDAWRADLRGAKDRDRKGRLEAMGNLQGHRGYYATKTSAEVDKDAHGQAMRNRMEEMGRLGLGGGEDDGNDGGGGGIASEEETTATTDDRVGTRLPGKLRPSVMFAGTDEQIPTLERVGSRVSHGDRAPLSVSFQESESVDVDHGVDEVEPEGGAGGGSPTTEDAPIAVDVVVNDDVNDDEGKPEEEEEEEEVMVPTETLVPPTYARVDIKFSFGLIVRSSAAEGIVGGGENLRNNETLRKCMEGTSKILRDELPTPPDIADLVKRATPSSFRGMFPEAYYDPILEPTVISIEEDEKKAGDEGEDGGGESGEKNKRTLVKASFPVFVREEAESEEGKKVYMRILKETKTTVFKSLRAAVSGGSFLKMR